MADLRISELAALGGADLAAADLLPIVDLSASETKKITVTDFLGNAITLLADNTIPAGKLIFNNNTIPGSTITNGGISATQLADDAVTAAKLADSSSVKFVTTLPASGDFTGQLAVDIATYATYAWNGSAWQSIKAAGSINAIVGDSTGIVNITVSQVGSTVTINTTLDNTTIAGQFLAGPSGSAGSVSYRLIAAADLPTATTSAKGAVRVNGSGLTMSGDQLQINNTVTANTSVYHLVRYDANGLVTGGRLITSGDLPAAAAGSLGAVYPGSGLSVSTGGQLNHSNAATAGTYSKVTIDGQGHVTTGSSLQAADIPNLDTSVLTSGQLPTDRIANDAVTGAKLANSSVTQFGGPGSTSGITTFPVAEFTGQYFYDNINGDLYLWDSNAWQPITITSGEIIFAGTFNASLGGGVGQIASVTAAGSALGLTVGGALPAAATANNRYYVVVSVNGTITSGNAPAGALAAPDMILSNGTAWQLVKVSTTVAGVSQASGITVTPAGNISSNNVQAALAELDSEKLAVAGGTITGEVLIGTTGALAFEGATSNAFQTYLTVTDPTTADRTITFPDRTGTVITTGDTSTVTNTMLAGSIALSKLAALTSGNIIVGSAGNVATSVAVSGDVTISNAGVVDIAAGAIINADINASAAIAFSKLAPLNSGSILVGNISNVATAVTPTGDVTITNAGVTSIAAGVIVNADVSASAAIAGTKISPDFGSQNITTTGYVGVGTTSPATLLHVAGTARIGSSNTTDAELQIGAGATGNRSAYIDFVGDTTYTDYGFRVSRDNTGANANSGLMHRGTGELKISTQDAAPITWYTSNAERARIDSSGRLLVGTSSARTTLLDGARSANFQLEGSNTNTSSAFLGRNSADIGQPALYFGKSRGSTSGANDVVAPGDGLGTILFLGADGTGLIPGASISAAVDGTPGTNDMPGRLVFSTTADGASSPTERMRIDGAGNISFASAGIKLATGAASKYISATVDSGVLIVCGGDIATNIGANVELYGGTHATNANQMILDANEHRFRAADGTSERARIDSSGRLLKGTSSSIPLNGLDAGFQLQSTATSSGASIALGRYANDVSAPQILLGKSRNSTVAPGTVVQANDELGTFGFCGDDGTDLASLGARIAAFSDAGSSVTSGSFVVGRRYKIETLGTTDFTLIGASANTVGVIFQATGVGTGTGTATTEPYTDSMPGRITFGVAAEGANSTTEALRITNDRVIAYNQPAPTSKSAAATLTVAELKTGIIQYTGSLVATLTLPTGTLTEDGFSGIYTNMTFEWSVINTGSGTCSIGSNTGHTVVGSAAVAASASGRFASRRTAADTWVTYRLSS